MTLTDSSGFLTLLRRREPKHLETLQAFRRLRPPFVTTWAVLAETFHLQYRDFGWFGQQTLIQLLQSGPFQVENLDSDQMRRAFQLMEQYKTQPMDLADATLVVLAEDLKVRQILTLDSDFHVSRLPNNGSFEVLP